LIARLLRAGVLTGLTDGLFSSVLAAFFYGSTVSRLWQGVASVLLGAAAFEGGTRTDFAKPFVHFQQFLHRPSDVDSSLRSYNPQ
jgi:hypothetical protein